MTGEIPFLDLVAPHQELHKDLVTVVETALRTACFVGGPMVEGFEREFAQFCEAQYSIGVNSGTDALRFALVAAGVQPGDIVITVPHTFIATTEAITQAGATPDFVDIDERTYTMDPEKLREYLETDCVLDNESGRMVHAVLRRPVTAIVPVHLYGQTADMDPILELAERHKLMVIEDACQAHGAQYFSRNQNRLLTAGSIGKAAAFSFYPGKNLGACGEAGAVTTNDEALAQNVRVLRDHGQTKKYYHQTEGYNGRLDSIQAGFLRVKLAHLADWNRKRQEAAKRYDELLARVPVVTTPYCPEWARAIFHLYVIRTSDRAGLQKHLADAKIGTGIHYPVPLHMQKAYEKAGYRQGDFPVTEKIAKEIVSLPMFPQITVEQQLRVVDEISHFLGSAVEAQEARQFTI